MNARSALACVCLALLAACGDEIPPGFERVNGSERLGWDQQAADAQELATFRYLVYVDEQPGIDLQGSCATSAGAGGFPCLAALPQLTRGSHSLRLSAYIESGGTRLESERSDPLNVYMVGSATSTRSIDGTTLSTADGVQLQVRIVAGDLDDPSDLAFLPDGGILIAERAGRVRLVRAGEMRATPVVTLPDVTTSEGGGLLAMAVDPQVARNGLVYLVYTSEAGFRLARFRAARDTLGDRAILLDGIPASAIPAATVRFGPDARLYLGLDDGGVPRRTGDLGSFNGKILRLNPDMTTPSDQAGGSPVWAPNVRAPRGLDWHAAGNMLWAADLSEAGLGQLHVIVEGSDPRARRGRSLVRYNLPDGARATGLTFYRGDRFPALRGSLLVAADAVDGDASMLRLVLDPIGAGTVSTTERLLHGLIDGARAIGVSPDGVIYLCTRTTLIALASPKP